ncbi:MAG: hypothetical protein O3A25_04180 [Acidobacteria bacterium]|nr:hypothetical protein [Acidobacteriota bacterium]
MTGAGAELAMDRNQPAGKGSVEAGYLSLRSLSGYSSLSVRTLRGYLSHPALPLPHYRVGGKILVKLADFDGWLAAFRVEAAPQVDALVAEVLGGL